MFREYERICSERKITGSVLEVGAVPSEDTLLRLPSLQGAKEKIGINLDGPFEFSDFRIYKCNANSMDCFNNSQFDAVLCNAMLEHDKYFWKTISEIKRVTKPGGLIIVGAPGYKYYWLETLQLKLYKVPLIKRLSTNAFLNALFTATITFHIHDAPGDYYRFSPQTFEEVFLGDMDDVEIRSLMLPPRIIGIGRKPRNSHT
jgi:SAM-dependent methyltransferase